MQIVFKDYVCDTIINYLGVNLAEDSPEINTDFFVDHLKKCEKCQNSLSEISKVFINENGKLNIMSLYKMIK